MDELVEKLKPTVEATIAGLNGKRFKADPIAGAHFSRIVSVMSSAYKRHGFILERAILERLKMNPDFEVWEDKQFQVPSTADHIVDSAIGEPAHIFGSETTYRPGSRTLQVDAIVYNKLTGKLTGYEVKRGAGLHDSGKRRSILRDLLCLQVLLRSYGAQRGLEVSDANAHIIFYYGECSIKKPFSLVREELDEHFGFPVQEAIEAVNEHFRSRLFSILTS
ncbi:hypothetical protein M1105_20165 [Limibaculum sp. FT325]|uniref:hypothetical protein n=1 Tax=Thermohalobaculum sediminis TaxID=2939436 RepID=UPI0020BDEDE2|nr:hypothetical protein [Limibaculum sediminis]MCL5779276.1 hypothetical protein [Limibaculum sediminis]